MIVCVVCIYAVKVLLTFICFKSIVVRADKCTECKFMLRYSIARTVMWDPS